MQPVKKKRKNASQTLKTKHTFRKKILHKQKMKTEQKHTKINPIINPNTKPQVQTPKRFKTDITNSTQKERKKKIT